jgi:cobalamin biosynthesis Mg chelatase CobN
VRSRSPIRALVLAGAVLALSAGPAAAQTSLTNKVLGDFAKDGVIDPCKHTSEQLRLALKNIPPDFEQYAPDYSAAIEAALEARARGECAPKKKSKGDAAEPAGGGGAAPTPTPGPAAAAPAPAAGGPSTTVVEDPPEPETAPVAATATAAPAARADRALERVATARASNPAPAPVVLLALLAAVLAASALFLMAVRRNGWEQGRLAPVTHAWREASFRTSGLWEDFRDWLRVGR